MGGSVTSRPHAHAAANDGAAAAVPARDRRVLVSAITGVITGSGEERTVRIVGLSAKTVLLLAADPIGRRGQCLEIRLPLAGGRDLAVVGGIQSVQATREGHAVTAEFIVVDAVLRRQLNELLALLLGGDFDEHAPLPRVVYDVVVAYGPTAQCRAHLHDLAVDSLSMRVLDRMAYDTPLTVIIPAFDSGPDLHLGGRVTGQRLSSEGGYHTTLAFDALDPEQRRALSALLADLMCR